jgi:hypothetical protein
VGVIQAQAAISTFELPYGAGHERRHRVGVFHRAGPQLFRILDSYDLVRVASHQRKRKRSRQQ